MTGSNELKGNAHIHIPPNFSAFDSFEQAIDQANEEGLNLLGLSNYYGFYNYSEFGRYASQKGVKVLFGMEIIAFEPELAEKNIRINDPKNPGKIYLCAKGIAPEAQISLKAEEILRKIRANDHQRALEMVKLVNDFLSEKSADLQLNEDEIRQKVAIKANLQPEDVVLQERHISRACWQQIKEAGILEIVFPGLSPQSNASDAQNQIRNELLKAGKPAYVPENFISLQEALELFAELKARPVYPILGDAVDGFTEMEHSQSSLFDWLESMDIHAMEWIPTRNSQNFVLESTSLANQRDFVLSAGTEHNIPGKQSLVLRCSDGDLPGPARELFNRGMVRLTKEKER